MANDPLIYMSPSDPRAKLISPAYLRETEIKQSASSTKGTASTEAAGSIYFPPDVGTFTPVPSDVQGLLPRLGDIVFIEEVVDTSVFPYVINLTFKIKNSTGYPIKGLQGRKGEVI